MPLKIGSLYVDIGADSSKLDASLKSTKGKLTDFKGGLKDVIEKTTGLSMAQIGVAGAIGSAGAIMVKSLKDTMAYAKEVRDLSRASNMGAEETSRLIQTFDDLGLSSDVLFQSLRGMTNAGLAPSVEEMARLSDEYKKLAPGAERNAFLLKNFGRAGLDLAAAMDAGGDAIRRLAEQQNKNLILTDDQVQASRNLEISMDELGDTWKGLTLTLGNELVPALNTFLTSMNNGIKVAGDLISWNDKIKQALIDHQKTVINDSKSYEEYRKETIRASEAAGYHITVLNGQEMAFQNNMLEAKNLKDAIGLLNEEEYKNAKAIESTRDAISGTASNIQNMSDLTRDYSNILKQEATPEQLLFNSAMDTLGGQMSDVNEIMKQYNDLTIFNALSTGLNKDEQVKLAYAMGLVDDHTLTAMGASKELIEQYRSGFITWDELIRRANDYKNILGQIPDHVYTDVVTTYTSKGNKGGYYDPGTGSKYASGGSYVVPANYNENYPVGGGHYATSGETVTISPTINVYQTPGQDATALAKIITTQLGQMTRRANRSGVAYAGR